MYSASIYFKELIEYIDFPIKTSNKLKKKYPDLYYDDSLIEIDYCFLDNENICESTIHVICETEHFKFSNKIEYNSSSPFALWFCGYHDYQEDDEDDE